MTTRGTTQRALTSRLLGTAVLTVLTLLAGVAVGGWLAFQTPHWEAFKAFIEGLPVLSGFDLGLLLVAVGVGGKLALEVSARNGA